MATLSGPYDQADLDYFGDLIEGRTAPSWAVWWHEHEDSLARRLPRPEYLRLKFGRLEYAAAVLEAAGRAAQWTPLGRARHLAMRLDGRFLGPNGLPTPTWFESLGPLSDAAYANDERSLIRAAEAKVDRARCNRTPGVDGIDELAYLADLLIGLGECLGNSDYLRAGQALRSAIHHDRFLPPA